LALGCGDLGGMVDVAGIQDRETLEAWVLDRSREDAVCIAHRAAMRVAPLYWSTLGNDRARQRKMTPLNTLWPLLTSGVARGYPSTEVTVAADASQRASDKAFASPSAAYAAAASASDAVTAATAEDDENQFYARDAADAADAADGAVAYAGYAVQTRVAYPDGAPDSWQSVRMDCAALEDGDDPFNLPLWDGPTPELIAQAWDQTRQEWMRAGETGWLFWIEFYENSLAGRPQDWPLLRDIALIPAEDWKGGPDRVHPIIEAMLLDRATQATNIG